MKYKNGNGEIKMAEYPSAPAPNDPVSVTPSWKTNVTTLDSGKEQRRQKWTFPKYDVSLLYDLIIPFKEG